MRILAGYYTNNRPRKKLLEQSLTHFITASKNGPVIPVVSSWDEIPDLPCRNVLSHFRFEDHGHLNILLQLLHIVHITSEQWDYFAFCEHDCLYPPNYFSEIERTLCECQSPGLASENHIGLFPNGFADCWYTTSQPLFAMVVRKDCFLESIYTKLRECAAQGWCCLEPDDRTGWYIVAPNIETPPIVHVNMNTTGNNHHLTNVYDFYSIENAQEYHTFWGNYRRFEIFTDEDMEVSTKPILPRGTYRIVDATYGSLDRTVSFLPVLKRKNFRGLFRVSNAEAGLDPAPGVVKTLRLDVIAVNNRNSLSYEFKEGSVFCL